MPVRARRGMTPADFARIALSLEGAEQGSHMGATDFRVGGRIFATLAHQSKGYGNLMLSPEQQAAFVEELPEVFIPVAGGWGRMGITHVVLARANEDLLQGALMTAWRLRVEKNAVARNRQARSATKAQRQEAQGQRPDSGAGLGALGVKRWGVASRGRGASTHACRGMRTA